MQTFNCLVLEDSLSDQIAVEMVLCQYPELNTYYVKNPTQFFNEISQRNYPIMLVDIQLQGSVTGIDLIQTFKDTAIWVIICSVFDSNVYYEQYKSLTFTKFYIQKPLEEYTLKSVIDSFLLSKKK